MEMVLSQPSDLAQFDAIKAQLLYAGFGEVVVTYSTQGASRIGIVGEDDRRDEFEKIVRLLDPGATPFG